ncbi:MAG TPA: anti-sigma factor [Anaerolineales bacterium]|nr:anti-sigma factor [Anaerolineales bacterium]
MSDDAHVLDLIPAFAIGALEAEDVARVETHLAGCLICREESRALEEVAAQLRFAAPASAPSPGLKERLITRVQSTRLQTPVPAPAPSRPWFERLLPAWGLASLVLLLALGALNLSLWQRFNEAESFTAPGGMRAVPLSPEDAASRATGFVLISADGQDGALVVDGLPPLDEDQEYQLWLIRDGERVSGAIFSTDENSYGGTRIRAPLSLLEYSAVGITVEPAGGSPQPTGERVLGGPLHVP